VLKQFNKIKN